MTNLSPRATSRIRRPRIGRLALLMLLVLAPLVAGELAVRALIATHRLPPAAAHHWRLDLKWRDLDRAGRVDVLLLGDSIADSGVDPAVLAGLVGTSLGREVHAFNLALPGTGATTSTLLLEELTHEGRSPRVAVLGISPVVLRGNLGAADAFRRSPMGGLFSRCADVADYVEAADCWFGQVSALWRWRGRPSALWQAIRRPDVTRRGVGHRIRPDGFAEGPSRPIERLLAQIPVGLAREDEGIALGAGVGAEYAALVRLLREQGVTVVGVLIPYSPPYALALEERHPGFDEERRAAARQLADATGLEIIDPGPFGPWWGDGSSQNIKHLSGKGAIDFTRQMWEAPGFQKALLAGLADDD